MKTIEEIKNILDRAKSNLHQKYHICELGIFGSYARGEQQENSDVDILIDYTDAPSLLELVDLESYLSQLLGIKTDVVTKKGLKPRYKERILAEVVYL